jgi:NAD-dependent deacetylase
MVDLPAHSYTAIHQAADIIRGSKKAIVLTGAGISTASGIPDFRSTGSGLWTIYDPFEVASLSAFRYHPEMFYQWVRPLADSIINARPNVAHLALARLQKAGYVKSIITQNIDRLHQVAGSDNVLEVHGSLNTMTCVDCYQTVNSEEYVKLYLEKGQIPLCSNCNHILKPDIILFGEQLPSRTWYQAIEVSKTCDLMIVAGSSLEVMPVAGLPLRALESGAHLIVVNQSRTYVDVRADVVFTDNLVEILPRIVEEVFGE